MTSNFRNLVDWAVKWVDDLDAIVEKHTEIMKKSINEAVKE